MKDYAYKIDLESPTAPARLLRMVGRDKAVLEIGCASGSQTRVMHDQLGCRVTAVEFDPASAALAASFCEALHVGSIEDIDLDKVLGSRRFDVITFGDVLEHLRSPRAAIERVRPYLTDSGYLVASIPNFTHASIAFEICHGRFDYRQSGLLDDSHIRFFTKRSIVQMFEDAGYLVVNLERAELRPEHTEFETRASNIEQQRLLDYIYSQNQESLTYQFVVKAVPASPSPGSPLRATAQLASERITDLEAKLGARDQRIKRLRGRSGVD